MTEELLKLAERCEAATGPDRELDDAILEYRMRVDQFAPERGQPGYPEFAFTASLDAAMTLMINDDYYEMFEISRGRITGRWEARFDSFGDECGNGDSIICWGQTPALAVTAACLKLRANMTDAMQEK